MKLLRLIVSCGLLVALPLLKAAKLSDADYAKMGLIKTAIVDYAYEAKGMGTTIKGTKTVYIDAYGQRQVVRTKESKVTKIFGMGSTEEVEKLNIMDGSFAYDIDLKAKTGTKMNMKEIMNMVQAYADSLEAKGRAQDEVVKEWVEKHGGKFLGHETVQGRDCFVIEMMGIKTWTFKNIPVQTEGNVFGIKTLEKATKIEENAKLPSDIFNVPAGIEITEAPDMGEAMKEAFKQSGQEGGEENPMAALGKLMQQANKASEGQTAGGNVEGLGMSLSEFKTFAAKLSVKGYGKPDVEGEESSYTATFRKSMSDAVILAVAEARPAKEYLKELMQDTDRNIEETKSYKLKGFDAVYVRMGISEAGPQQASGSHFYLCDTKRKVSVSFICAPARSREEIEGFLTQLGY